MTIDELNSAYLQIIERLKDELFSATRKPQRYKAYFEYLYSIHELSRNSVRDKPTEHLKEFRELVSKMTAAVGRLLAPTLDALEVAIQKERKYIDLSALRPLSSYDDGDFWDWVAERVGRCVDEVREAEGVMERVDAVRDCLDDIHDRAWEEIGEGLGRERP